MALLGRPLHVPRSFAVLFSVLMIITTLIFLLKTKHYYGIVSSPEFKEGKVTVPNFHSMVEPSLQLIPRYTILCPWTVLTLIFAEISILGFIRSSVILYVATTYVERFWGSHEVIKFVVVVGTITNTISVVFTIIVSIFRRDSEQMDKPLGGGITYVFGFLVVLKQLIPEHNILLFQGLINFRIKHLPFVMLVAVTLWSALIGRLFYPALPSWESFFVSYIYLRFFQAIYTDPFLPVTTTTGEDQTSSGGGATIMKGDASDTFVLVDFFPVILRRYLAVIFDLVYGLGVKIRMINAFDQDSVEQSNLRTQKRQEQANNPPKTMANSVAERRRQMALQVIEDRINKDTRR